MVPSPWIGFKALSQLGIRPVAFNALYRLGLVSGHYRRMESREKKIESGKLSPLFTLPKPEELLAVLGEAGKAALIAEADEILDGKVRLFGTQPVDLQLTVPGFLAHWTAYEINPSLLSAHYSLIHDIKFIWEPARFGWVFCLGRAYHLTRNERYAESFWRNFEIFTNANPSYLGPNWISGQEAALRAMAFVWAAQIFSAASSSTPGRKADLADAVALHAARIVLTLVYARSQQNNHLLTEAAGLLTAGLALSDHPKASRWRSLGWKFLSEGLQSQIDSYGEYAQHSTNYHRLMLQVVLWANALISGNTFMQYPRGISRYRWPHRTHEAILRSIHWLLSILDPDSGQTLNLGANDGAYIFPMTVCPFSDYRPVLNASARLFLEYDLPAGPWDELALWFGIPLKDHRYVPMPRYLGDQAYGKDSWAYLRTAQFISRPSHADQLHVDLWWQGLNVAQDAGTYLYNADLPWDNSLTSALVHNTVTVNYRDQFRRAGRFLYLDWFNAYRRTKLEADPAILQYMQGRHWGYRKQGVRHERTVTSFADGHWQVRDDMLLLRIPWNKKPVIFRLHWLLPDWEWSMERDDQEKVLCLLSPHGPVGIRLKGIGGSPASLDLVRAGSVVFASGSGERRPPAETAIRGWASPTYGVKVPALSLTVETKSANDVQFISEFVFPI